MRIRSRLLVLLGIVVAGCTTAPDPGPAPTVVSATTAAAQATAAKKLHPTLPPPGLLPTRQRRPAPALQVTAFDDRTVA
jgi:hypothetical protein